MRRFTIGRVSAFALALTTWPVGVPRHLLAQGVTTAMIGGVVTDRRGVGVEGAEIRVVHGATGFVTRGFSRAAGRYVIQGLPVGGPYTVVARRIGYREATRDGLVLDLGEHRRLDFVLEATPTELSPITIESRQDPTFSPSHTGAEGSVSDALLHRLPTADRDLYSFLSLVPQMSTRYGPSGGGVNYRFNDIQLDGALDQAVYGGNAAASVWGARPISIEAVQEYEVLLSPYDVRYGDFAGALINGVTKSGTNRFRAAAFVYARNEQLARDVEYLRASPYDRAQFGFTVAGPLVHDRVHFFVASEFQRLHSPASGPYIGQDASIEPPVPVTSAQVDSLAQVLQGYGLVGGSGGRVTNSIPGLNLFGRLDAAIPGWNSRLLLRYNFSHADSNAFSRPISRSANTACPGDECFPLSSLQRPFTVTKHSVAAQLSTQLPGGTYNELRVGYTSPSSVITTPTPQPLVLVDVPSATAAAGFATLQAGTPDFTQGFETNQDVLELSDVVTMPLGTHRLTCGATTQFWHVRNLQTPWLYGIWEFASLDSLEQGTAREYRVSQDQGGADATMNGLGIGLLAGDQWQVTDGLSLTLGVRLDVPLVRGAPPYSSTVDSAFGRRTDVIPSGNALWSPRAGFNWQLPGAIRQQLRGGAGLFAGRPPLAWLLQPFQSYGKGLARLTCNSGTGGAPPFPAEPDYRNPPLTCANGVGFATAVGQVNFVDEGLRFPQTFRATLAYDRELPGGVVATLEALYTKAVHDFWFLNRNLQEPVGSDRNGRTMYGALDTLGVAAPNVVSPQFARVDVMELRNQSRNYAWSATVQLAKRFSSSVEARAGYNYSVTRDVQSHQHFSVNAGDNWRAQPRSGRQDDQRVGVSAFDQPHRVVVAGTFTAPWRKWRTHLSFYYVGGSGTPYTYVVGGVQRGTGRTGDLNADGSNANDPPYVPVSALDTTEIRFGGPPDEVATQQQAFETFVNETPCLRAQRGRILERNSCRSPWVHTLNAAVRQAFPSVRGHTLAVQVEVFNLLNLLSTSWGAVRLPSGYNPNSSAAPLLTHVGQRGGQPVFRFGSTTPRWSSQNLESYYQIQLSARYSY